MDETDADLALLEPDFVSLLLDLKRDISDIKNHLQLSGHSGGPWMPGREIIETEPQTTLEAMEKEQILKALQEVRGNRRKAAAALGISERTLYRKIREYDIN